MRIVRINLSRPVSYLISTDSLNDGEYTETAINASIRLIRTGSTLNSSKSKITHTFTYEYSIDGGVPPYQVSIQAKVSFGQGGASYANASSSPFSYTHDVFDNDFDGNMRLLVTVTDSIGTSAMFESNSVNFPTILN